jgi:endonuclease IV
MEKWQCERDVLWIGPHYQRLTTPQQQRELAVSRNWTAMQTHVWNPQSLTIPDSAVNDACQYSLGEILRDVRHAFWSYHAAYVACASPNEKAAEGTARYLLKTIEIAYHHGVEVIVMHTGATSGVSPTVVRDKILHFFDRFHITEVLAELDGLVKVAVELGANKSEFNMNPHYVVRLTDLNPHLGWCLDTAHAWAAGITREELAYVFETHPPLVCHANFPGSPWSSGRDVHGWRCDPQALKNGSKIVRRNYEEEDRVVSWYDTIIKLLVQRSVPLIMEGSGFSLPPGANEIETMRQRFCPNRPVEEMI